MCQRHGGTCEHCGLKVKELVFGKLCKTCRRFELKHGRLPDKTERHHKTFGWKQCRRCKQNRAESNGLCIACDAYKKRTGKDRPIEYFAEECLNCGKPLIRHGAGIPATIHGKGLCRPCYQYQWEYGVPRPERLWSRGEYGYCDCGKPATHTVTVRVMHHNETMPLCDTCHAEYQRQVAWYGSPDIKTKGNIQPERRRSNHAGDD